MGEQTVLRVLRTKEEAQWVYDRLSRWYDYLSGTGEYKLAVETLDLMDLHPGDTFLEVGSGTGKILLELTRRVGQQGRVYGVDLSHGMCCIARRRVDRTGVEKRTLLTVGDGYRLPITPGSADGVFMGFTLELFDTPELLPVLQECLRVLKPGGRLGIVTLSLSDRFVFAEKIYKKAHSLWPRFVDCRPIDLILLLNMAGISHKKLIYRKLWGLTVAQMVLVKN
jgi:ubiquinone/menaquinone biosynthesis C-methylase UbiE